MQKKKIIISFCCLIILFLVFIFNFDEKKSNNSNNKQSKDIKIEVDKKFESKLYSVVLNDVSNDYSYHDYKYEENLNNYKYNLSNYISYEDTNENYLLDFEEEIIEEKIENNEENKIIEEKVENNEENKIIEEKVENNEENEEKKDSEDNIKDNNEIKSEESEDKIINKENQLIENEEIKNLDNFKEDKKYEENNSTTLSNIKNGFYEENGVTYYYENNNKITGIKNIDGVNNYFSPSGRYLGTKNIKVIDVSYYQGNINWDDFVLYGDYYGVILRIGYYTFPDKKFEEYIENVKRLNIPYGIYLFSYAGDLLGSNKEASFTINMIDKYDLNPTLGIYYDIESWTSKNATSDNITKELYDEIIENYVTKVSNHINNKYKVKIYSGRWYAMNRLGNSKKYVDWVAEYNNSCLYDGKYSMWQYTSQGVVPGINGNVDISYLLT